MKIQGKVLEIGELVSAPVTCVDWEKQDVVIETTGTGATFVISFMGERKTTMTKKLKVGDIVNTGFRVRCRKWGEKWFTNLEGLFIELERQPDAGAGQSQETPPRIPVEDERNKLKVVKFKKIKK